MESVASTPETTGLKWGPMRLVRALASKRMPLIVAALVTALDLWSKSSVFASLGDHERNLLIGSWFGFTKVWNPGTMWGAFQWLAPYLPYVRVLAAVVVLSMIISTPVRSRWLLLALGLVLGGALGNIYDGFAFGKVRDFLMLDLDVRFFDPFPIFNVADSAICVGVGMLALSMWSKDKPEDKAAAGAGTDKSLDS